MIDKNRILVIAAGLVLFCGFLVLVVALFSGLRGLASPASEPTIDLFATLSASTPVPGGFVTSAGPTGYPTYGFPTVAVTSTGSSTPSSGSEPMGKIAFTCQIFKLQESDQICIINADGTGFRRLTTEDGVRHFYPSMAPNGQSVVYSGFRASDNSFSIYELQLVGGFTRDLTTLSGAMTAPEISPDGSMITFTRYTAQSDRYLIWLMKRNGDDAANIPGIEGWDPTWSPDGKYILFASDRSGSNQLYIVRANGKELHQVGSFSALRGRSDWSPDGKYLVTYSGAAWEREVYIMNADGTNIHQLSPSGGNSQGPSFSPDGKWVAFTAYYDHPNDIHGCEIYIIRVDGTDLRRLTDNNYCDYQPRWGP